MLKSLRKNIAGFRRGTPPQAEGRRRMKFETLEPRILLSADLGLEHPVAAPHNPMATTAVEQPLMHSPDPSVSSATEASAADGLGVPRSTELIFVDSAVDEYRSLVDSLRISPDGGSRKEIHLLEADRDGIGQISEVLRGRKDVAAVHILAHGSAGEMRLGSSLLNTETLAARAGEFGAWGQALTENGDILLYGCGVASGTSGIEFIESLALATGADVAASDDPTGAAALGGNWELELSTGAIEAAPLNPPGYASLLAEFKSSSEDEDFIGTGAGDTYHFSDGWGEDGIVASGSVPDTLDFSAVTADLTVTFHAGGAVSVTDGANALEYSGIIGVFIGGTGNNTYVFEKGATFAGLIDGGEGGINLLDLSGCGTPALVDLGGGTFSLGGSLQGAAMVGFSGETPVAHLNLGVGVDTATLASDTTLASLGVSPRTITTSTLLSVLNLDQGVDTVFGKDLRIILSNDDPVDVDFGPVATVGDIIAAINAADPRITAKINTKGNGLILTDTAGGARPLSVINLNGSTTARDLGLDEVYTGATLNGRTLVNDLRFTLSDGSVFVVSLSGVATVQDALRSINESSPLVDVSLNDAGNGFVIRDIAAGVGDLKVESLYGTGAAEALGIAGEGSGAELRGSSLRDNLRITLRDGTVVDVNIGGVATVQDILDAITAAHVNLTAAISGYGITVTDASGGLGKFSITSLNGCTAAEDLGLAQTAASSSIQGNALAGGVVSGQFTNIANVTGGSAGDLIIGDARNQILTGGGGGDTFAFADGWGADTVDDLGTDGIDTLDFSAVTADLTFTFHADGGVSVTDGVNTLARTSVVEHVIGGSGFNTFVFEDGAEFYGTIDGGIGGTSTLDYSAWTTAVSVDLSKGTATGTDGVRNITNIIGGFGDDTLIGDFRDNLIIGGEGADSLNGVAGADTLIGGLGNDIYAVNPAKGIVRIVEAVNGGTDSLVYSGYSGFIEVNLSVGTATGTSMAANVERVLGGGGDVTWIGSSSDNTFAFSDDWGKGTVADPSDTDTDTLDFSAVTTNLTFTFNSDALKTVFVADDRGNTLTGATGGVASVTTLVSGTGDDTFIFADGWGFFTIADAGDTDYDTLDFSAVTADIIFTFHDDGTVSATDGLNSLGRSAGINNIVGGRGVNRFVFENAAVFDGFIKGGPAGSFNILDYSAWTTVITMDLTTMDKPAGDGILEAGTATGVMGVNGIQEVVGGLTSADILVGFSRDNVWTVSGVNCGNINGVFTFSSMEILVGQDDHSDTFAIMESGSVDGAVIGSLADTATGLDAIRLEGVYTDVVYYVSGVDAGTILRDGKKLNYAGIEWVNDESDAATRTFDYVADKTVSVSFAGLLFVGSAWGIVVDGVEYGHTVTNSQSMSDVVAGLAAKLVAAGYLAVPQGNTLVIAKTEGGKPNVSAKRAGGTSTVPDSVKVDIENATTGGVGIRIGRDDATGRLGIFSLNGAFGYFQMSDPTTLIVRGGAGDDTFSVGDFTTAAALHIDGEEGTDTIVLDVHGGPAATIDSSSATSTALVFSGTPHAGQTWTVALSTLAEGEYVTMEFSHVVTEGQTLPQIIQALAALINTSSGFAAGVEDMTLFVSLVSGGDLAASASILATTQAEVRSANAATATSVTLGGTPGAGEAWGVIVDSSEFMHTVAPGESLEDVLDALAKRINASPAYAASVLNGSMTIVKFSGDALRVRAAVPQGASSTITPFSAQTRVILLEDDPLAGETLTVTVDGTAYSHVVLGGEKAEAVLEALAGKIGAGYIVAVKDRALVVSGKGASMSVSVKSLAFAQAVPAAVTPTSSLVLFEGVPHDGEVWSISLTWATFGHKATFSHTVSGNESLAQVLADLAAQIDGLEGYTAAFKGGLVVVTSIDGASLRLEASVPASASRDIGFTAEGITLNGVAGLTHSGVENARNLIFTATSGADEIVLAAQANGRYQLLSTNGTFGSLTFDALGDTGSLVIRAGRGDDTITLDTSFASSLSLSGGAGKDTLNLGANLSFSRLAYGTDFEYVTGEGTVKDMVFNAYGADDSLSKDHYRALAQFAVSLPFCLNPVALVFAGRGVVDAVTTDVERRTSNTVEVTRTGDGKIQITDTYKGTPHSVVVFPTESLTINTGLSYLWAHDTVLVKDLGTVNFDLTINAGRLNTNEASPGDVKFSGTTSLNGRNLAVVADTIVIEAEATVSTSSLSEAAGGISMRGHQIVLEQNSRLLAEGAAAGFADDGDILLDAVDNAPWRSPLANVDVASVGVTVKTGSVIRGRDVALFATVDNGSTVSAPGFIGGVAGLTDKVLGLIESLAKVELAVSVVVSSAVIDIQETTAITSRNFTAYASTAATSVASPLLAFLLAGSASVVVSDATVGVAGSITVSEDAVIRASTEQTVKAVASAGAVKGVSLSTALNVVVSEATAHVVDTAILDVGGNLYVMADNTERLLTIAKAQAGTDGIAGMAAGVSVEHGLTNAWLDGNARVDGNVLVSASMSQDAVPIKKALVLPMSTLGTWVTAGTGSNIQGDIPEDLKSYLLSPVITCVKQFFAELKGSIFGPSYGPDLPGNFGPLNS